MSVGCGWERRCYNRPCTAHRGSRRFRSGTLYSLLRALLRFSRSPDDDSPRARFWLQIIHYSLTDYDDDITIIIHLRVIFIRKSSMIVTIVTHL